MKEDINLLPPTAKLLRLRRLYLNRLGYLLRIVLLILLLGVGSFISLWVAYYSVIKTVQDDITAAIQDQGEVEKRLESANQFVQAFTTKVDRQMLFTGRLEGILRRVPSNVRLTRLELVGEEKHFVVEGVADSLDTLVVMQKEFESLEWVTTVDAPLQNFATAAGGKFSFTLAFES